MLRLMKLSIKKLIIFLLFGVGIYCEMSAIKTEKLPAVLHVMLMPTCTGSVEVALSIYKNLLVKGYPIKILIAKDSYAEKKLIDWGLPFFITDLMSRRKDRAFFQKELETLLINLCQQESIRLIHCHKPYEYRVAKRVADKLKIKIAAFYHLYNTPDPQVFKNFDIFLATSPVVAAWMKRQNKLLDLGIQYVDFVCPPFNEERIINFVPQHKNAKDFFKEVFNINLKDCPIICTISNFYTNKNHELLFKAMNELINKQNILVQVVLAGTASDERILELKNLVKKLNIDDYVFFLGFTQRVPDILFFSDFKVFPSRDEAWGIVILESALMKKATIILRGTGAETFLIKDGFSGLLSRNDPRDLANKIKKIIAMPSFGKELGERAYELVKNNFDNETSIGNIIKLYKLVV